MLLRVALGHTRSASRTTSERDRSSKLAVVRAGVPWAWSLCPEKTIFLVSPFRSQKPLSLNQPWMLLASHCRKTNPAVAAVAVTMNRISYAYWSFSVNTKSPATRMGSCLRRDRGKGRSTGYICGNILTIDGPESAPDVASSSASANKMNQGLLSSLDLKSAITATCLLF